MNPRSPGAFMLSTAFHALVIGVACLFTLDSCQQDKPQPRILELVAGAGENYGATEAPKLGTPGGVKVDIPPMPVVKPDPTPEPTPEPQVEPAPTPPPEPAKVTPAPTPPPKTAVETKKAPETVPNFKKQILKKVWRADANAKRAIARERAAEERRLKKEEFDRQQRAKAASAKSARSSSTPRVSHIDADGIAQGVIGGSSANKVGGAGGKALTREQGTLAELYYAELVQKVRNALEKPPGVSDQLSVTIVFHISASGEISNVRVEQSSGSDEWDNAVVRAFSHVRMGEHPLHRGEDLELEFRTKDANG